ncbi:MAG: Phosphate butyryltransferase [Bacteroidota bacterium]|nr:Phosphate butyryltransferase [Bacteroidota bacterium]
MSIKSLNTFFDIAKQKSKKKIAVAAAEDEQVLQAVAEAEKSGIVEPILVGNYSKIKELASSIGYDVSGVEIIDEINPAASSKICVKLVRDNKAQILMKGFVGTADYLRAILDKDNGLRSGELLSHISFFEVSAYHKLIALTDAAQNIAPGLDEKIAIIQNSVDMFHRLGIENPKVAILAAVETVNPKMSATMDAAILTQMNARKQIKGCIIDGPLAFDLAVSSEAAEHKGIESNVAGDADLLLTPNIESGNMLYKSFTYFAGATVAAVILGALVPVVLTSRADSDRSKLLSIALAAAF